MTYIELWWARSADAGASHERLLDARENARLAAYRREEDRLRFRTAAVLSRLVLGQALGIAPERLPISRDCPDCERPHGRPRLPRELGLTHSVSHSGGHVVVAVHHREATAPKTEVGVDVEVVRAGAGPPTDLVLAAGEYADPWPTWVRKESALKATGDGLRIEMARLRWQANRSACGPATGLVRIGDRDVWTHDVPVGAPAADPDGASGADASVALACVAVVGGIGRLRPQAQDGSRFLAAR